MPVSELKDVLNLARKQYLKMMDSSLPSAASCLTRQNDTVSNDSGKKK